jgi:hypothetical protein
VTLGKGGLFGLKENDTRLTKLIPITNGAANTKKTTGSILFILGSYYALFNPLLSNSLDAFANV